MYKGALSNFGKIIIEKEKENIYFTLFLYLMAANC